MKGQFRGKKEKEGTDRKKERKRSRKAGRKAVFWNLSHHVESQKYSCQINTLQLKYNISLQNVIEEKFFIMEILKYLNLK